MTRWIQLYAITIKKSVLLISVWMTCVQLLVKNCECKIWGDLTLTDSQEALVGTATLGLKQIPVTNDLESVTLTT